MGTHTYKLQGVTDTYLSNQLAPGYTASVSNSVPVIYQEVALSPDDDDLPDLDAAMAGQGWVYDHAGAATVAKTIAQIVPNILASDASSIPVASGWVDVLTSTLSTMGGSAVGVQCTVVETPTVGAPQARVVLNGGSFSNVVIGAPAYTAPILTAGCIAFNIPASIPSTAPSSTSYTFKLQMQASGILGTVVPKAGTAMTLVEYH